MKDPCGVIFDVDGVLVDSYDAHFESWQVLGRERGLRFSEQQFRDTFGRTTREILAESPGASRCSTAEIAELDARKEAIFREILSRDLPLMEGAVEIIDLLSAAGYRLAVGSSGPPENVQLVLEGLQRTDRFRGIVTGVDVTRGKPDPQVFLLAAERIRVDPRRCLVIEDAAAGLRAARRAGMRCAALLSKGHTRGELGEADVVLHSLRELSPSVISQLLNPGPA
jgi:beta-phosphoglucomutase